MKIAVNTQHTGDRAKDHRGYAAPMTSEQLDGLLSEDWLTQMVVDIRGGNEKLKDKLPYLCPHYAQFKNNHRAQRDILPEMFTFMTCVDVDDKELVDKAINKALELNGDAYSEWHDQVLRIEYSARKKVHIYIRIPKGMTIEEAQLAFCKEIDVPYDESCITPERFIYLTGKAEEVYRSKHWMEDLSEEELNERREAYLDRGLDLDGRPMEGGSEKGQGARSKGQEDTLLVRNSIANISPAPCPSPLAPQPVSERTLFIFRACMKECELEPEVLVVEGARHEAVKSILSVGATQLLTKEEFNAVLSEMMPQNWQDPNIQTLVNDFYAKYHDPSQKMTQFQRRVFARSRRLNDNLNPHLNDDSDQSSLEESDIEDNQLSTLNCQLSTKRMPMGIRDSIDAVGPQLAMPALAAVCPCIGALATGVVLDVHAQKKGLNLISYIAGDFASGKGQIDPVVEAWMSEVIALDKMYQQQEEEYRNKKKAAKNKKEQPDEPQLPVRYITLNNTVAKLAERLANTEGKHAFSFTPEADTVAQKWRSVMSDFSVMLRQSYDGSKFDREAKSVEAVNVHIDKLLWNVVMCGTPDALYRVVSNYTDGFQSRIAVARTPDNTFAPLEEKPRVLTDRQMKRIQQVAHLLPLMQGEVVLPKLEAKGREWLEKIRLETMKNDDRTKARQRIRVCVTAQRMTCCVMLCKVCETLIQKHGFNGAETQLKQHPNRWKEVLLKMQTPQMLEIYDVIADSLLENALFFFRDRIENAFNSRDYAGSQNGERTKRGKNDSIFERLDVQFTFEQAMQHSVAIKGAGVTRNTVMQMLKNWRNQGLVVQAEIGKFRKVHNA